MQLGLFFDQTRCTGCYACQVACKDWHGVPAGPANWMKVARIEEGKFPHRFAAYVVNMCYHCADPPCVAVCPAQAINKREEDGVVIVDSEKCEGGALCDLCSEVCPYRAPQFGAEENPKMYKCDFCLDRLTQGKLPICVAACPTRALDWGPLDELRHKYGDVREAPGFPYSKEIQPSILFKPKKMASPYVGPDTTK